MCRLSQQLHHPPGFIHIGLLPEEGQIVTFGIRVALTPEKPGSSLGHPADRYQAFNKGNLCRQVQGGVPGGRYRDSRHPEHDVAGHRRHAFEIFWMDASQAAEYAESVIFWTFLDFLSQNEAVDFALGKHGERLQQQHAAVRPPYQCNVVSSTTRTFLTRLGWLPHRGHHRIPDHDRAAKQPALLIAVGSKKNSAFAAMWGSAWPATAGEDVDA